MYVTSDSPIPQNSLLAPPAAEGARANARRLQNFYFSRHGRERVYANTPTVESFYDFCPGLAVHAKGVLDASELARQSILNGIGPTPSDVGATVVPGVDVSSASAAAELAGAGAVNIPAPAVYSLNGPYVAPASSPNVASSSVNAYPTMPAPAPVPGMGVYVNVAPQTQPAAAPRRPVRSLAQRLGPGCGLSGFGPAWGDAFIPTQTVEQGGGVLGWIQNNLLLSGGLVAAGLFLFSQRKGRR